MLACAFEPHRQHQITNSPTSILKDSHCSRETLISDQVSPSPRTFLPTLSLFGPIHECPQKRIIENISRTNTTVQTSPEPQSWVSLVTPATSGRLPVQSVLHIARRGTELPRTTPQVTTTNNPDTEPSRKVVNQPTPASAASASISSAHAAATRSSVPSVWTPATSAGAPKESHARPVSLSSHTTPPTTNSSEPIPSPAPPSSRSMPLPSVRGTRPTTVPALVASVNRRVWRLSRRRRLAMV